MAPSGAKRKWIFKPLSSAPIEDDVEDIQDSDEEWASTRPELRGLPRSVIVAARQQFLQESASRVSSTGSSRPANSTTRRARNPRALPATKRIPDADRAHPASSTANPTRTPRPVPSTKRTLDLDLVKSNGNSAKRARNKSPVSNSTSRPASSAASHSRDSQAPSTHPRRTIPPAKSFGESTRASNVSSSNRAVSTTPVSKSMEERMVGNGFWDWVPSQNHPLRDTRPVIPSKRNIFNKPPPRRKAKKQRPFGMGQLEVAPSPACGGPPDPIGPPPDLGPVHRHVPKPATSGPVIQVPRTPEPEPSTPEKPVIQAPATPSEKLTLLRTPSRRPGARRPRFEREDSVESVSDASCDFRMIPPPKKVPKYDDPDEVTSPESDAYTDMSLYIKKPRHTQPIPRPRPALRLLGYIPMPTEPWPGPTFVDPNPVVGRRKRLIRQPNSLATTLASKYSMLNRQGMKDEKILTPKTVEYGQRFVCASDGNINLMLVGVRPLDLRPGDRVHYWKPGWDTVMNGVTWTWCLHWKIEAMRGDQGEMNSTRVEELDD